MNHTATVPLASAGEMRQRLRRAARPRGRQAEASAVDDVRACIGERPADGHRRDLLIEHLHRVNDCFGALSRPHLVALAREMNLPMAEVFEVASFYHHFEILEEGEAAPRLTVRVCEGLSCQLAGPPDVGRLRSLVGEDVRVVSAPCIGRCEQAPAVLVGQVAVPWASEGDVVAQVRSSSRAEASPFSVIPARAPISVIPAKAGTQGSRLGIVEALGPRLRGDDGEGSGVDADSSGVDRAPIDLPTYRTTGGYTLLTSLISGARSPDSILTELEASQLRGLGGAGFPAGRKWRIVRDQPAPRLMALNIDEGEPGTFKDRHYLERDPHRFLEGMLIAAHVVGISAIYIYLRDEYHDCRHLLQEELAKLQADPPCPLPRIELRRGAGAYICGEESAMIESIEGKRGEPRMRPPYIAQVGLFGRPTLEHNFETLYWIREVVEKGGAWFASHGRRGRHGLRSFSVSGRVKKPGVHLAPAGISLRELVDEYCGGMQEGHELYAYLPGGASGGILPASLADLPLDFDTLQPYGCFIGSAAIIVLGHQDRARDAALAMMHFFADESCGQCTPCRVGTAKAARLMAAPRWDRETLEDLAVAMTDASICGLGQAAPNPLRCVQQYFPHEIE